jgi:cytochrome c5
MSQVDKKSVGNRVGALVLPVVVASVFLLLPVAGNADDAAAEASVEDNIKPVGQVNIGSAPAPAAAAEPAAAEAAAAEPAAAASAGRSGEEVYTAHCAVCHTAGVAGAPKVGDSAAWAPRAAQGIDTMLANATNGLNAMPPKGTCGACSADELKGAIEYMLAHSGH